ITVGGDGVAKAVRVGVALVDGRLWSSGTADRMRTERLRDDPRCSLFVFDAGFGSMTLETTVTVLDGPDARLFRVMQGKPTGPLSWFGSALDDEDFLRTMAEEQRLIYEFEVQRTYGLH
ncbi:MAG: pyridoxamine 5'-phosphate oxidase family protein, partial [Acidimicrobiales bacterium]